MSAKSPHYEYRLGFRYASKACCAVESEQGRRDTVTSCRMQQSIPSPKMYIHRPLQTEGNNNNNGVDILAASRQRRRVSAGCNGRERQGGTTGQNLAAIQVQRAVRGWQARVLAVKMVHDRAWRALILIQAIWRGVLARRYGMLRREGAREADLVQEARQRNNKVPFPGTRKQRSQSMRRRHSSAAGYSKQHDRCPERAAWEQSWGRVRRECPNFRDRVRVWQTIAELKRAGGRGRMGITNNEAYAALRDSSGSISVAATLLSNEEYLLGRRLLQQDERRLSDEIPPCLSLALARHRSASSAERPSPAAKLNSRRSLPTTAGREAGFRSNYGDGDGDIFECISGLFYQTPRTTKNRL